MSQTISATSSLPRAPAPADEPPVERTDAADGFATLLAGLFPVPSPTPPAAEAARVEPLAAAATRDLPHEGGETKGSPDGGNPGRSPLPPGIAHTPEAATEPDAMTDRSAGADRPTAGETAATDPAGRAPEPRAGRAAADMPPGPSATATTAPGGMPSGAAAAPGAVPPKAAGTTPPGGEAAAPHRGGPDAAGGRRIAVAKAIGATPPSAAAGTAGRPERPPAELAIPGFGRLALARIAWQPDLAGEQDGAFVPPLRAAEAAAGVERPAPAIVETAAATPARPVQQLALAIGRAVEGEVRRLTVQLSPRELGSIEIALELDADRRLAVVILAERPETLELLRQDARQLERLLGQQGQGLADAGLELGLMGEERQHGRERPLSRPAPSSAPRETGVDGDAGAATTATSPGGRHRLNLSI